MMTPRRGSHSKAFTLVEIIVVSALIALIAGIATLSWHTLMLQTKKKTTHGDVRTLAHSLSATHFDIGMFPKLCFLYQPKEQFNLDYGVNTLPGDFDGVGHPNQVLGPRTRKILSDWEGPYYNNPRGRGGFNPGGAGGVVQMELPDGKVIDWPADPWDNPYVVYLVNIETGGTPTDPTIGISWIKNPYEKPNHTAIVVSYGPNRVPGGTDDPVRNGPFLIEAARYTLYTEVNRKHYQALTYQELSSNTPVNRLTALTNDQPFGYLGDPAFPGIMDPESDDIYIVIP